MRDEEFTKSNINDYKVEHGSDVASPRDIKHSQSGARLREL